MSAAVWTVEVVPDSTWCSWFSSRWCSSGEQQYVCNVCRILQWITLLLYNQQPKFVRDISDTLTQINKKKVNWSHYRPGVAQRVGRGIALLFHDCGTGRGWVVSSTALTQFTPRKDPVSISQEAGWAPGPVWMGGKSRSHRDSIPDRPARSQSLYRMRYPAHDTK